MFSSRRKAGLGFILFTLFLDIFGIGLLIPILPRLLESFAKGDPSAGSRYFGVFVAVYALMQFLFSPVIGSLSDRFGRRKVLLVSLFGQGVDYLLLAMAPSLGWLFVGRVISGITGASMGTASAYIADVSPPEKRAQNFGLIGMAFGLGFIAGPMLGGLLGGSDLRLPFFVASGLTLTNWLFGLLILPESLAPENRRPFSFARSNPVSTLSSLGRYPVVMGLLVSVFLFNFAQRGLETTWVLYTAHRYDWDVLATGISLALLGICAVLVQGVLIRPILKKLGERRTLICGVLVGSLSMVLFGLATKGWMLYSVLPLSALGGIAGPAAQGLMSKSVPANEQGMLQGGLSSLVSLTQIVGPLVATNLFSYFIRPTAPVYIPGIAFFLGAVVMIIGLLFARRTFARVAEAEPVKSLQGAAS